MKIFGFYHIYMANHWQEIVSEQVQLMISSGLYQESEEIFVGALGQHDQLDLLTGILKEYPKFKVIHHSVVMEEFEFCTLRMIRLQSQLKGSFNGFYIHTKGASYPRSHTTAYIGGTYWRQYMNYYNLKLWEKAVDRLNTGSDLCGVKLLRENDAPAHRLHYSGNFFWFRSQYVKRLKPVEQLNLRNRFEAETWIGSEQPIAATLCQDFVDYNTQKNWEDPT